MDVSLKTVLKAVTLELRHLLEGWYDGDGQWKPGDLEQRPAAGRATSRGGPGGGPGRGEPEPSGSARSGCPPDPSGGTEMTSDNEPET